MAIAPSGTFDYVATVPHQFEARQWTVSHRTPVEGGSDRLRGRRLVGLSPSLEITDAGLTPNPGYSRGIWRPEVLRCRLTLRATDGKNASVSSASFCVDRGVVAALRPGDLLYMARTPCAGLALSAVRDGNLVFAIGAVTKVPLGNNVSARMPLELLEEAEAIFRRSDRTFEFRELPIELTSGTAACLLPGGSASIEGYDIRILHGFLVGIPGTDECLAISRKGLCSDVAAGCSARLIDVDGMALVGG
jgi:hypothetical protein